MITHIVRIGNSQGVRIPKPLIEQAGLTGAVEMIVQDNSLVIRPAVTARAGWAAAFQKMAQVGDDRLLDESLPLSTKWDEEEWEW